MQHRERGAAHINIYFFLVLLVMFMGTLWFGYLQMTKVNVADANRQAMGKKLAEAQRDLSQRDHYIKAISEVVGSTGRWDDNSTFTYTTRYSYLDSMGEKVDVTQPAELSDVSSPSEVQSVLQDLARKLNITESLATPIAPFAGQINDTFMKKEEVIKNKTATADAAIASKASAEATARQAQSSLNAKYATAENDAREREGRLDSENKRKKRAADDAMAAESAANDALAKANDDHAAKEVVFKTTLQLHKGQADYLQGVVAMVNPPESPDGAFINASHKAKTGWINIGRKDMLPLGTKFKITNAAGTKVKGYCEVTKVNQDNAEVRLTEVVDRHDQIVHGDKIYSPIYGPNLKRSIAMIGRFSYPYPKPMIKKILEALGNTVHDEVKVGVDLVIVGGQDPNEDGSGLQPIEEIPGYKTALSLRIELITIHKIRHLLKLGE